MTTSLNNSDLPVESAQTKLNYALLADIWRIFVIYDRSATNAQKRFMFLRLLILRLSVIVTLLAVLQSQLKSGLNNSFVNSVLIQHFPFLPNLHQFISDLLGFLVILAPISVSILLAGTIKFGRGVSWILLRSKLLSI